MPWGLDLFPHDIQVTSAALVNINKQFDAVQTLSQHVIILLHQPKDTSMVLDVLRDRRYQQMEHLFWHKSKHTCIGPVKQYTRSVEMMTIGFHPERNRVHWSMSSDPMERHNFFECQSVTSLAKGAGGEPINVTKKPRPLAQWYLGNHCPPNSRVCVVGAGAGGEVLGACEAGINVVGLEVDKKQFDALRLHMVAIAGQQTDAIQKKKDDEQKKLDKELAELKDGVGSNAFSPQKKPKGMDDPMCADCGEDFKDGSAVLKCASCEDTSVFHQDCLVDIMDDNEEQISVCTACKSMYYPRHAEVFDTD